MTPISKGGFEKEKSGSSSLTKLRRLKNNLFHRSMTFDIYIQMSYLMHEKCTFVSFISVQDECLKKKILTQNVPLNF